MLSVLIKIQSKGKNRALRDTSPTISYAAVRYDVGDTDDMGHTNYISEAPYYVFRDDVGDRVGCIAGFRNCKVVEVD